MCINTGERLEYFCQMESRLCELSNYCLVFSLTESPTVIERQIRKRVVGEKFPYGSLCGLRWHRCIINTIITKRWDAWRAQKNGTDGHAAGVKGFFSELKWQKHEWSNKARDNNFGSHDQFCDQFEQPLLVENPLRTLEFWFGRHARSQKRYYYFPWLGLFIRFPFNKRHLFWFGTCAVGSWIGCVGLDHRNRFPHLHESGHHTFWKFDFQHGYRFAHHGEYMKAPGVALDFTTKSIHPRATAIMISALAYTGDDENTPLDVHAHEHSEEYHRDLLLYYCLTILPILALLILLPSTCYSMVRRHRFDRDEKLDWVGFIDWSLIRIGGTKSMACMHVSGGLSCVASMNWNGPFSCNDISECICYRERHSPILSTE